jgi:hypothetical protein
MKPLVRPTCFLTVRHVVASVHTTSLCMASCRTYFSSMSATTMHATTMHATTINCRGVSFQVCTSSSIIHEGGGGVGTPLSLKALSQHPPLLCIPGAMGTARTDFEPQLCGIPAKVPITMVSFDPRGYGNSRPPVRDFPPDYYEAEPLTLNPNPQPQPYTINPKPPPYTLTLHPTP